jgi:hypothetical protein
LYTDDNNSKTYDSSIQWNNCNSWIIPRDLAGWDCIGHLVSDLAWVIRIQPIRNKIFLWQPCLLSDCVVMWKVYRVPSLDDLFQISDHLAKRYDNVRFSWPILSKFNTMKPGTGLRLRFIYVICEKIQILLNIKHQLVLSDSSITVIVGSNA